MYRTCLPSNRCHLAAASASNALKRHKSKREYGCKIRGAPEEMADVRGGIDVEYGRSDFDALGGHEGPWGRNLMMESGREGAIKWWKGNGMRGGGD